MDARQSSNTLKVFLVDHTVTVRRRLAALLASMTGIEVVGEAEELEDALTGIHANRADVAIVELSLVGSNGLELISAIARMAPKVVVVVLTNRSGPEFRAACKQAGADHFFDKTTEFGTACRAIRAMARVR